jgi:hypothetical protein
MSKTNDKPRVCKARSTLKREGSVKKYRVRYVADITCSCGARMRVVGNVGPEYILRCPQCDGTR